jgi:hypothetical protein
LQTSPGGLGLPKEALSRGQNRELTWTGGDGTMGHWKISASGVPYRPRLKYFQMETAVGPFEDAPDTLNHLWTGEAATQAIDLPLKIP